MSAVEATLTDAKGRTLKVIGLSLVEQYRLFKAIGPAASTNVINASMAQCAASVRDIDGVPLPYPTTEAGIELNLSRIGDEGYAAYFAWLGAETAKGMADAEAAGAKGGDGPLAPSAASPSIPA